MQGRWTVVRSGFSTDLGNEIKTCEVSSLCDIIISFKTPARWRKSISRLNESPAVAISVINVIVVVTAINSSNVSMSIYSTRNANNANNVNSTSSVIVYTPE